MSRTISRSVSLPQVMTRCALCRTTTTASTATTTTAPMDAQQMPTVLSPTLCVGRFSLTDADVVRIQTARLFIYSHDRFWLGNWPVLFSVTFNQVGYTCSSTDSRCTAPVGKVLLESVKVREQIIKQTLIPLSCCLFGKPLFELCLGLHLGLHWLHNRGSRHQPLGGAEL